MGFDKPQKIKANAQGGHLAAPAWTAFMNEVYKRRPSPKDWVMPPGIVTRTIDVTTNMLVGPYCPRNVIANEVFIAGTDPVLQCDVHTGYLFPDTSGVGAYPYPSTSPYPSTYPPTTRPGGDTSRVAPPTTVVVPGTPGSLPRTPRDTSRRPMGSSIFSLPPRRPPGDTTRPDTTRPRPRTDTLSRRIDTTGRVPPN
jgi:penicillin-binding protein 1A